MSDRVTKVPTTVSKSDKPRCRKRVNIAGNPWLWKWRSGHRRATDTNGRPNGMNVLPTPKEPWPATLNTYIAAHNALRMAWNKAGDDGSEIVDAFELILAGPGQSTPGPFANSVHICPCPAPCHLLFIQGAPAAMMLTAIFSIFAEPWPRCPYWGSAVFDLVADWPSDDGNAKSRLI